MLTRRLAAASVALFLAMGQSIALLHAQTTRMMAEQRRPALSDIRASVIRVLSAEDQTVEVNATHNVLTVSRNNSSMNGATHGERNTEAMAIASTVSMAIAGKPEFKNILAIHVQYLAQSAPGARKRIIDTVEFRKDPAGNFSHHQT
jgi:hypothetical protein